jgi:dTDP-L-rhamnose 4-epimerase
VTGNESQSAPAERSVLVTGGAGFIGCALSQLIAPNVARWTVIDSLHPQIHPSQSRPKDLHPSAELIVADVTEAATWETLLADLRPDLVIHLAAETGTGQSLVESSRHAMTNVVGTAEMIDAFVRHDAMPNRIVLASSRAVYGEGAWERVDGSVSYPGQRSHEQLAAMEWDFPGAKSLPSSSLRTVPSPSSIYGATKLAQENVLRSWCAAFNVSLGILRLQNVYGPGQSLTNAYTGIVTLFSRLARRGGVIPVYEDGMVSRDFVFIYDVARAFEAALFLPAGSISTPLDIGSGIATTLRELASSIAKLRSAPGFQVTSQFRDGDVRHATCDIGLAKEKLGWHPEWPLDRGLAALQQWVDEEELRHA